jgi:hypothetical protein
MQRRSVVCIAVWPDDDFHVLIESHEEAQKPFNRKLPELAPEHFGYVRLANAKQSGGFDLFHVTPFHNSVDFVYQLRLDQMLLGIRHSDILEDIPASDFVAFLAHGVSPFVIRLS